MPLRTIVLLVIAVPVAVLAYIVTTRVLQMLELPEGLGGLVLLFVPLFVAGLCALPFIAPTFDHFAKKALAERPTDGPPPGPGAPRG